MTIDVAAVRAFSDHLAKKGIDPAMAHSVSPDQLLAMSLGFQDGYRRKGRTERLILDLGVRRDMLYYYSQYREEALRIK